MAEPVARRRVQVAGITAQGARSTEYGARNTKHAILNTLSAILLLATVAVVVLYLLIALRPTVSLNPFPPPTAHPSPTPTVGVTEMPMPTSTSFPTPTPLRPAPLTPTPEPSYPFTATVETGPLSGTPNCQATLRGVVLDREGHGLEGYPVHLWAAEADPAPDDRILFSDRAGRWQAVLPTRARGLWYIQLHAPDARQVYPPLSAIIAVRLPESCPQASITFRASR